MAEFVHIQRDFSGGEISGKLYMRDDLEVHSKALASMVNFIPTLQGTAVRTPGTRFFREITNLDARIIPFLTQSNEEALIVITPATAAGANDGQIEIITDITPEASNNRSIQAQPQMNAPQLVWENIIRNPRFRNGLDHWWVGPEQFPDSKGDNLGVWWISNTVKMQCRDGFESGDNKSAFLSAAITVPEATTKLNLSASYLYQANFSGTDAKYTGTLSLGTAPFTNDLYVREWNETNFGVGSTFNTPVPIEGLSLAADQVIYLTFNIEAINDAGGLGPSAPLFTVYNMRLQAEVLREITSEVIGAIPYIADELADIHFVQSPYGGTASGGKEMVLVHPNYPPSWIKFSSTVYVWQHIPFTYLPANGDPLVEIPGSWPDAWGTEIDPRFPSTCTSFNGRLILAGSSVSPALGSLTGYGTETVWGTKVGQWASLTDPLETEVNPDDSIEFTSIYRSPIEWVAGHKELLIGAREMEYVASADGIFQPADIGVSMQSTHGSAHVQPVGLGETVLFPAEGGTRIRSMNFRQDDDGYVSPDLTFMNPTLLYSGVVRMVRMRNPHQIVVVVMGNGMLALLSYDPHVGVIGWCRIQLSGTVRDACVLPDNEGRDVLFVTIERRVEGVQKLYIESFRDWAEGEYGDYLQSASQYTLVPATNIITGLEHLEGKRVQVVGDNNYLGVYTVTAGAITLLNQIGDPLAVSTALVGLPMRADLLTVPLVTAAPGGQKRFTKLEVRGVFTTWATINVQSTVDDNSFERPLDRSPSTLMGESEPIQWLTSYEVANLGSDLYQVIHIRETVPFRTEVLGIYGKVKVSSVS